ncbi:MAG: DUF2177 family protein [Parvularculaceae bacterium]|jgi:uncharacterized membrane protein|nr:DUF2177 family protein [Parvularculaceae bacterium]
MKFIIAWFATAAAFAVADAVWLSQAGPRLYRPLIGEILRPDIYFPAAIAFYLLYVTGLVYFAVAPGLSRQSLLTVVVSAALLGLVAYGAYDLTNQATLKVWDGRITAIDMAWGAFASALAACAGYLAAQRWGG